MRESSPLVTREVLTTCWHTTARSLGLIEGALLSQVVVFRVQAVEAILPNRAYALIDSLVNHDPDVKPHVIEL